MSGDREATRDLELRASVEFAADVRARPTSRRHHNELGDSDLLAWTQGARVVVLAREGPRARRRADADDTVRSGEYKLAHPSETALLVAAVGAFVAVSTADRVYIWSARKRGQSRWHAVNARVRQLAWDEDGAQLAIVQDHAVLVWDLRQEEATAPFLAVTSDRPTGPPIRAACWHATRLYLGSQLGQVASLVPQSAVPRALDSLPWRDLPHQGSVCSLESGTAGVLALCGAHAVDQVRESVQIAAEASKSLHSFGLKDALFVADAGAPAPTEESGGVLGALMNISGARNQERAQIATSAAQAVVHVSHGVAQEVLARCEAAHFVSGLCASGRFAVAYADRVEVFAGAEVLSRIALPSGANCRGVNLCFRNDGDPLRVDVLLDIKATPEAATAEQEDIGKGPDFASNGAPAEGRFFFADHGATRKLSLRTYMAAQEQPPAPLAPLDLVARIEHLEARLGASTDKESDLHVGLSSRMDTIEAKLDQVLALLQR